MRAVVTRVSSASVSIAGELAGAIERGYLVLLGVGPDDTDAVADKLAGIPCRGDTSCPDQLSKAIRAYHD